MQCSIKVSIGDLASTSAYAARHSSLQVPVKLGVSSNTPQQPGAQGGCGRIPRMGRWFPSPTPELT